MKKIAYIVCLIVTTSCGQKQLKHAPVAPPQEQAQHTEKFPAGEVIPSIRSNKDTTSFALYLPKSYSDSLAYPLIVFFDPQGEGSLPLKLYQRLADEYRFILAASNSSHNGLDMQAAGAIATGLLGELTSRFAIDPKKIAFCGFSGGAKVALHAGSNDPRVASVIYCGAAMEVRPTHPISLLGFAGTKDMNYTDLVTLEWNMQQAPFSHLLVEWNGDHRFPDAAVFRDAFIFLSTGSVEKYAAKQVTISPEKVSAEQEQKRKYIEAFQKMNDLGWWKKEIAALNKQKQTDPMYERLLGFISLACWSIVNNALQQNDLATAEAVITIYSIADPKNPAWKEFAATLNSRKNVR